MRGERECITEPKYAKLEAVLSLCTQYGVCIDIYISIYISIYMYICISLSIVCSSGCATKEGYNGSPT